VDFEMFVLLYSLFLGTGIAASNVKGDSMSNYYWNDWYSGWGWFLWLGIVVLIFSSVGNWGYTYRAHSRFSDLYPRKDAVDILDERYAKGQITHEEYREMKSVILTERTLLLKKVA
jgi:putative membrane protein